MNVKTPIQIIAIKKTNARGFQSMKGYTIAKGAITIDSNRPTIFPNMPMYCLNQSITPPAIYTHTIKPKMPVAIRQI